MSVDPDARRTKRATVPTHPLGPGRNGSDTTGVGAKGERGSCSAIGEAHDRPGRSRPNSSGRVIGQLGNRFEGIADEMAAYDLGGHLPHPPSLVTQRAGNGGQRDVIPRPEQPARGPDSPAWTPFCGHIRSRSAAIGAENVDTQMGE